MTIKSNLGTSVINILTTDTTLFAPNPSIDRYQVGACNVYNTSISNTVLRVYVSPDTTSASGNLVETIEIRAGEEEDINSIVGQGYTAFNIILVGAATGLNASLTRTEYSGGS